MTNAWTWWEKSKATVFPACYSWLDFRVRGQFEIAAHKHNVFHMNFKKSLTWACDHLKTSNLTADNFKKILDLYGSALEPAIQTGDTGQRIPCLPAVNWSQPGGSHKLVSAAVRCVGPSWRHSKLRRAASRIFENGGVIVFHLNTLSLFFPVNEAAMWFLFSSRIPLPHIPTEKVSVFWLLRENSAKKVAEAFWWVSKLGKLCECGAGFRSTKTRFCLDRKHEKTCSFAPK